MPLTEEESKRLQEANDRLSKAMAEVVEASKLYLFEVKGIAAGHGEETKEEANRLMHEMIESAQVAMDKGKDTASAYMDTAKTEVKKATDYSQEKLGELRKRFSGEISSADASEYVKPEASTEAKAKNTTAEEPPVKKANVETDAA